MPLWMWRQIYWLQHTVPAVIMKTGSLSSGVWCQVYLIIKKKFLMEVSCRQIYLNLPPYDWLRNLTSESPMLYSANSHLHIKACTCLLLYMSRLLISPVLPLFGLLLRKSSEFMRMAMTLPYCKINCKQLFTCSESSSKDILWGVLCS